MVDVIPDDVWQAAKSAYDANPTFVSYCRLSADGTVLYTITAQMIADHFAPPAVL